MHVNLVWLAAVALSLPLLSECTPLYVMSAPNLLRLGMTERVFLEAQDYNGGDLQVEIKVRTHPRKEKELVSMLVSLTAANNYQILQDIWILDDEDVFPRDPTEKQYVYLQAHFPTTVLEKIVLVSVQRGYIFVQTDKTIYTPSSTVHYRVFSLGPGMQPDENTVVVDVMTPDGISVERDDVHPNQGLLSRKFLLTDPVSPGTWKIVSRFKGNQKRNFTANFEVKEYVLPSFEVTLNPERSFFYIDDDSLTVDIEARYLFGKKVDGSAYIVFGVMLDDTQRKSFPASIQRVEISDGSGLAELKKGHILQTFPRINELIGKPIYMTVSVLSNTGSEMVEAQKTGIQIVTSPYTIQFTKTPAYFKPGMPFDVSVLVTNPDGSPAKGLEVEVGNGGVLTQGVTGDNGIAKTTVNTNQGANVLQITAKTADPQLTNVRQGKSEMTAKPYAAKGNSHNYLHIGVDSAELTIGDQLKVNLHIQNPGSQGNDLTYMILSKGQIVSVGRFSRRNQVLVSLSLPVTKDMLPSFRFVAYYHVGTSEVVSDSLWVDVKDTCMGKLKVEVSRHKVTYEPKENFELSITGDPGAKVGLVAVDKGVYVLNKKNRLTQTKIWDIIEKHDTGCTAGSGKDSMGVFYDAGLLFESNTAGGTNSRTEPTCPSPAPVRRRREVTILEFIASLTGKHTGLQKECCEDGLREKPQGYTCERRSEMITDGPECVKAFLHCCTELAKRRESAEPDLLLSRSEEKDNPFTNSDDVVSRTDFPESWLWQEVQLPVCQGDRNCDTTETSIPSTLKDSITSWQITAISLSKTHGICVADNFEMVVVKDFFIDLKLPYSAVRNEQLEIKAVLHNYLQEEIRVRVELYETDTVCSMATQHKRFRTIVSVASMSTRAVPFVIIPTALGTHAIEVKAMVAQRGHHDGVKKNLLVVAEGVLTKIEQNVQMNPTANGGQEVQLLQADPLRNRVAGTRATTHISASGQPISISVEKAISGLSMGSLIIQPGGCGEQNMIYMTLPLIATHYLDNTKQWAQVGLHLRSTAIGFIQKGYVQELAYRSADGAYAVWVGSARSTWLTAYVAKVFAIANNLVAIERNVICSALNWLLRNAQNPDGAFVEKGRVSHKEMTGNIDGQDGDVSMTAFVLIALQEGAPLCNVDNFADGMRRAVGYVERRMTNVANPYAAAMGSYALANAGRLNTDVLMKYASAGGSYWSVGGTQFFTLEATAYALLALVKVNDFHRAAPIVRWLNSQKRFNGGYGSTQSTIMVFQAVAEYQIRAPAVKAIDLEVEIKAAGTKNPIQWLFQKENIFQKQAVAVPTGQDLTFTAKGSGEISLSVLTLYYANPVEDKNDCKNFELDLLFEREDGVTLDGAFETYKLTIDIKYLSTQDAAMSILDVSLLTGFVVDENDLREMSAGRDRSIQKFEMDKQLSERGSLIIYLDKVSHIRPDRIVFRTHQMLNSAMLQPAGVTVYEYYSMENQCKKFYHPLKEDGSLNMICEKDVCECAEAEKCSLQRKEGIVEGQRNIQACSPHIDYIYKALLVNERPDESTQNHIFNMRIVEDYSQRRIDDVFELGDIRAFTASSLCRGVLNLKMGKHFLIMGHGSPPDLVLVNDKEYQYALGDRTWIEYWPTEEESQTSEALAETYQGMQALVQNLQFGCR